MINERELNAMVQLLDDTDEEVVRLVEERILSLGEEVIPLLEDQWGQDFSLMHQERLEHLIHKIQFDTTLEGLRAWRDSAEQDLFEGFYLLTRYRYPHTDKQELSNKIDKIKLDAWLELHYDLTALEKVRILNHIFYNVNGFKGNTTDYHSPNNSYLNTVLESRQGNPISLAIIYSIVAQRLGIPVFGVNLPQHFILGYCMDFELDGSTPEQRNLMIKEGELEEVMFYINPFNKGLVFTKQNIDEFVKHLKIQAIDTFFKPCNNVEILKRVLRNLAGSYTRNKELQYLPELAAMMEVLGGKLEMHLKDDERPDDPEE